MAVKPKATPADGASADRILQRLDDVVAILERPAPRQPVEGAWLPDAAPPDASAQIDVTSSQVLAQIAQAAREHSTRVGEAVNPTNTFAIQYEKLADIADGLAALIAERGHTGVI